MLKNVEIIGYLLEIYLKSIPTTPYQSLTFMKARERNIKTQNTTHCYTLTPKCCQFTISLVKSIKTKYIFAYFPFSTKIVYCPILPNFQLWCVEEITKKIVSIGINCYQSANLEWSSPIRSEWLPCEEEVTLSHTWKEL